MSHKKQGGWLTQFFFDNFFFSTVIKDKFFTEKKNYKKMRWYSKKHSTNQGSLSLNVGCPNPKNHIFNDKKKFKKPTKIPNCPPKKNLE